MASDFDRRRVLVAAAAPERSLLAESFRGEALEDWEALEADSFERARFILQHDACDVLLVDESLYRREEQEGLTWLTTQRDAPVVFLAKPAPEIITPALDAGVSQWLPRDLALANPALLAAALNQAARWTDLRRRVRLAGEALFECRRQVTGLVSLLWETSPVNTRTRWLTQRHTMERLHEEVTRSERYRSPFTLALGEVEAVSQEERQQVETAPLAAWTAERIGQVKRRCDVAGQYGPHGFMLLLGQTPVEGAVVCCRRLQALLEQAVSPPPGARAPIHAYFGLSAFSASVRTPQAMLSAAELRLEKAKAAGKDRLEFE